MKEDLSDVLDSNAVAANVNIRFNQKAVMCSEAAMECSSHCKFIGMFNLQDVIGHVKNIPKMHF